MSIEERHQDLRTPPGSFLVIGYGNELRGDDAAGPRAARAVEALNLPSTRVVVVPQLAPEIADEIAQADFVVFVDAALETQEVRVVEIAAEGEANIIAHANSPAAMLALAQAAFGRTPKAWTVTIPVAELGFAERLSPVAQQGVSTAIAQIQGLAERFIGRSQSAA